MRELVPRLGEGFFKLGRILQETPRNWLIDGIHAQRHVGRGHHRREAFLAAFRIGDGAGRFGILRSPLIGAARPGDHFPIVLEQHFQVVVVPSDGRFRPSAFNAARDGIGALAAAKAVFPAEALFLEACAFGFRTNVFVGIGSAMRLAESVPAGDKRDGFFVVHRHASKGFANVAARSDRIRCGVRPLRVHINETHLHRAQGRL